MPMYQYEDLESGEVIERYFSMTGKIPVVVAENGKEYRRVYGDQSFHIPAGWNESGLNFSKKPNKQFH